MEELALCALFEVEIQEISNPCSVTHTSVRTPIASVSALAPTFPAVSAPEAAAAAEPARVTHSFLFQKVVLKGPNPQSQPPRGQVHVRVQYWYEVAPLKQNIIPRVIITHTSITFRYLTA